VLDEPALAERPEMAFEGFCFSSGLFGAGLRRRLTCTTPRNGCLYSGIFALLNHQHADVVDEENIP